MAVPDNYKEKTRKAYDQYAEEFSDKFAQLIHTPDLQTKLTLFIENLPGKSILDAGAGSGDHALLFQSHGFNVLCIDLSEKMVKLCRTKGLRAEVQDLETCELASNIYDGIWANTSLLHIPKDKLPTVLQKLARTLRPKGLLSLTVKEGSGERNVIDKRYPGVERFFSYFQDEEVRSYFDSSFKLLYFNRSIASTKSTFLEYIYQKQ